MKTRLTLILLSVASFAHAQIQPVNLGTTPNDGTGDNLRAAFTKVNANDSWLDANKQALSANLTSWSALAPSAKQDASASLSLWSAISTSAKQDASANLSSWSALAPSAKQAASANLTSWSSLATSSKQDASANLASWSAVSPSAASVNYATTSGNGVPDGVIVMWSGTLANIPAGWLLCDGANGTPDLRDRFIKGAAAGQNPGGTGGGSYTPQGTIAWPVDKVPSFSGLAFSQVINHTHTATVTDPGHSHLTQRYPTATGASSGFTIDTSMSGTLADNTQPNKINTTGITVSTANPAGGVPYIIPAGTIAWPVDGVPVLTGTAASPEPAYFKLAFIMKALSP